MDLNCSGIYKITNKLNKKIYVGATKNIRIRKNNHLSRLRQNKHNCKSLQLDFNKYGETNFIIEVLEVVADIKYLEIRENFWISELKANDKQYGYNKRKFCDNNKELKHSEETKELISKKRKNKGMGKRILSEETKKIKSEICKNQNLQQYHTREVEEKRLKALKEKLCDKPISEKHKKCISKNNSGQNNGMSKLTKEDVEKILILKRDGIMNIKEISRKFNVNYKTIYSIISGKSWKDTTLPFIEKYGLLSKSKNKRKKNISSKLTKDEVIQIKRLYKENKITQKKYCQTISYKFTYSKKNLSKYYMD